MERKNFKKVIGVIGGHNHNTTEKARLTSKKIGMMLAENSYTVATGGEDGIMESVCEGVKSANGTTIAIIKGNDKQMANKYIDYVIATSLDLAFMNVLIWSSDCILAFTGRYGTLSEIGLALDIGKPLIMIGDNDLLVKENINRDNFIHFDKVESKQDFEKLIGAIKNIIQ